MDSLTMCTTLDDGNRNGGCLEQNMDYDGDDLKTTVRRKVVTQTGVTATECRVLCQRTEGCKYFTHGKSVVTIDSNSNVKITDNKCFLKWGMGTRKTKLEGLGFTSGAAFCPASNGTYVISSLFLCRCLKSIS